MESTFQKRWKRGGKARDALLIKMQDRRGLRNAAWKQEGRLFSHLPFPTDQDRSTHRGGTTSRSIFRRRGRRGQGSLLVDVCVQSEPTTIFHPQRGGLHMPQLICRDIVCHQWRSAIHSSLLSASMPCLYLHHFREKAQLNTYYGWTSCEYSARLFCACRIQNLTHESHRCGPR